MESVDLESMSNNSQVYLDAMSQLKNEYEKLEKNKIVIRKLVSNELRKNLQISSLIQCLVDMLQGIADFPEEIIGLLNYIEDKSKENIDGTIDSFINLILQENENISI